MQLKAWQILNKISDEAVAVNINRHPATVGKYHRGAIPEKEAMRNIFIFTRGVVQPNDFYDLSITENALDEAFMRGVAIAKNA